MDMHTSINEALSLLEELEKGDSYTHKQEKEICAKVITVILRCEKRYRIWLFEFIIFQCEKFEYKRTKECLLRAKADILAF